MGQGGVGVGEAQRFATHSSTIAHAHEVSRARPSSLGTSRKFVWAGTSVARSTIHLYSPQSILLYTHTKFGKTKYANLVPSFPNGQSGTVFLSEGRSV